MNKKFLVIGGIALALIALAFLFMPSRDKKKTANKNSSSETNETVSSSSGGFTNFSDAPSPGNEDSALEAEAEKLWPHLAKQDTSAKRKEKVKEEWNAFASKYPKNFYIPAELKAPMTEAEAAEKRREIDIVTKMESKLSVIEINARKSEPGSAVPKAPGKPDVTPEEQRIYIGFKTKELESRIQLIEYSIENSGINGDQLTIARKDISEWKRELTQLQEVERKIPNS
jgi:hypothetical protein